MEVEIENDEPGRAKSAKKGRKSRKNAGEGARRWTLVDSLQTETLGSRSFCPMI